MKIGPIILLVQLITIPQIKCYIIPQTFRLFHITNSQSNTKRHQVLTPLSSEPSASSSSTPSGGKRKTRTTPKRKTSDISLLKKRSNDLLRLTQLPEVTSQTHPPKIKINKRNFNWLIDAWAFSGHPDAAQYALSLLQRMESHPLITPDVRSYTKVINALSRSRLPTAGDKAEEILERMNELSSGANPSAKPNTYTYTGVIEAWSNSGRGVEGAQRAEALSKKMVALSQEKGEDVKPTARSFNAVISAWAKSRGAEDSAQRAEDTLEIMEELYARGDNPDVKPNVFNYNAVMSAWSNSGEGASAADHIEGIFERMKDLYEKGDEGLKPTSASYNTVISAWAKVGNAARAEELLWEMENEFERTGDKTVEPNLKTFNSVINAWAKSRDVNAAYRAEQILTNMTSISATNPSLTPDVTSFSTVINAWARSHNYAKADRARNILRQMQLSPIKPNTIIFNSVMNACAFTVGDEAEQSRAMEIAHETYMELEDSPYGTPDEITFGTFLKVCSNQMPDNESRQRVVHLVFKKCCNGGMVGDLVLQQVKVLADDNLFWTLMDTHVNHKNRKDVTIADLPREW
eukprot:CAMPEP_0172502528 /NCGR_PEP_ID=MMETSP1066-20121228/160963_1 /TAXON_ID=671091 /ORGANISM="Coscinodiscus wailesii, Strain CCMP2513" /LENGTH=575 /DNA_ID=CAMNT_0013277823 /DNA_START=136 /DNA_END=1860 /DNA_ORIENTATION=-